MAIHRANRGGRSSRLRSHISYRKSQRRKFYKNGRIKTFASVLVASFSGFFSSIGCSRGYPYGAPITLNAREPSYYPLHGAANRGSLGDVKRVLNDWGQEIDRVDPNQGYVTAAQVAYYGGHVDVVLYLVKKGASVNKADTISFMSLEELILANWNPKNIKRYKEDLKKSGREFPGDP